MARLVSRYSAQEMAWKCEMFFPEERRSEFTHLPWDGVSFRHFADPKVICIEHFTRDVPTADVATINGKTG